MLRIGKSIQSMGHDVKIIGRILDTSPPKHELPIEVHHFHCLFNSGPLFYLEYNIRLFLYLMFSSFDIIYSCDADTILACASAKVLKQKKGIYDSHEIFDETPEVTNRKVVKFIWNRIERIFAPKMDLFFTVNESLVDILGKRLRKPFRAIRNLPFIHPQTENSIKRNNNEIFNKILIYQGVLNVGRGLETYIDAMSLLPNYQLWIIGDGDIKDQLISLTEQSEAKERIKFLGKKTPQELDQITPLARYGLNLLEAFSPNYYHSLANKFFDYMAHGIPSINMNFPLYQKYCQEYKCGITMENLSAQELSKVILKLDAQPHTYAELRKNSLESHKLLNWQNEELKLKKLLMPLLTQ